MTEKEKMLSGVLYNSLDKELTEDRNRCKDLCGKFNALPFSEREKGLRLIREILADKTADCSITAPFWCDYGYNIKIGKRFYSNHNLVILDCGLVTFGDDVLIGPNCGFYAAYHPTDPIERAKTGLEFGGKITVGNNVWFGGGVQVLAGVTIGDNCVIGAGSVVTKDIPADSVAVGNPCRVIKQL